MVNRSVSIDPGFQSSLFFFSGVTLVTDVTLPVHTRFGDLFKGIRNFLQYQD